MPCKCDPSQKRRGECCCRDAPPIPGGSPQRVLTNKKCGRYGECGTGMPSQSTPRRRSTVRMEGYFPDLSVVSKKKEEPPAKPVLGKASKIACISLQPRKKAPCTKQNSPPYQRTCPAMEPEPPPVQPPCTREEPKVRKPLKKRETKTERCQPSRVIKTSCGVAGSDGTYIGGLPAKIFALEKTLSKTQWQDEEGYHSASVTMSQIYRPEDQFGSATKSCGSDKRRNYLRAKLRELMGESKPIPEGSYLEGGAAKPEPEVVAAALLMSEGESTDLGKARPDRVFNQLFSSSSPDRAVALASAAPGSMNSVVVPITVQGRKPPSLDVPNSERMVESVAYGAAAPNPSVFQESDMYQTFTENLPGDIAGRSPEVADISSYIGVPLGHSTGRNDSIFETDWDQGILEYVIRPEPPAYRNRVRLNGSVRPSWFPGYAVVSPLIPDCVRLSQNPGEALRDAWCLCRPRHFDDLSKSLVNTG